MTNDYVNLRRQAIAQFERDFWSGMLRKHGGNVPAVAAEVNLHRSGVYNHIKRLGIAIRESLVPN